MPHNCIQNIKVGNSISILGKRRNHILDGTYEVVWIGSYLGKHTFILGSGLESFGPFYSFDHFYDYGFFCKKQLNYNTKYKSFLLIDAGSQNPSYDGSFEKIIKVIKKNEKPQKEENNSA